MRDDRFRRKSGFRLLYSPAEMALGARFARSRQMLVGTVVVLTGLFTGYSMLTAGHMRQSSRDVVLNLVLISGALLFLLAAAYFQTLLVGDLLFPGRWRERVVLARKVEGKADESEQEAIARTKDYLLPFYLIFIALIVANYLLYGWVTHGFLSEYHTWRYQHTLLRSPDAQDRIRGIRNLTSPLQSEAQDVPEIRSALVQRCSDPDPEVQQWALWASGELLLYEAAATLRDILADEQAPDQTRARAAEALGFLANREGAQLMADLLVSSMGRDDLALGLLRGLGLARWIETGPQVALFLNVEPIEVRAHSFWALGRTRDRRYREQLLEYARQGSPEERCFAGEALKYFVSEEDRAEAHALFSQAEDLECQPVVWRLPYHWDEDSSFTMEIVVGESLKAKFLKVIFASGGLAEREFLLELQRDPTQSEEIRRLARELAQRIANRR